MRNGPLDCGVQETKQSAMSHALSEMEQAVERLEEAIKMANVKFGPVLVIYPACDPRPCDKPPSQPCSELASLVRSYAERVESFRTDLMSMMDRCDL